LAEGEEHVSGKHRRYVPDDLDLLILEKMIEDSTTTFKQLAVLAKTDQRTIANRYARMKREGIVRHSTIEVDWAKLGLTATAFIGTATSHGDEIRKKLFEFIEREPRIFEAHTTLGSHEYSMTVLDTDMERLREGVCDKLEPLTMGLSTAIVVKSIKSADHKRLIEYIKKTRKRATM
jgi:Lrp/AsnC family transcriptional regulator